MNRLFRPKNILSTIFTSPRKQIHIEQSKKANSKNCFLNKFSRTAAELFLSGGAKVFVFRFSTEKLADVTVRNKNFATSARK